MRSQYRTGVEVSSDLNDREPANGVNTSRTCRHPHRNIRVNPRPNVARHTDKWPSRTTVGAGVEAVRRGPNTKGFTPASKGRIGEQTFGTPLPNRHLARDHGTRLTPGSPSDPAGFESFA